MKIRRILPGLLNLEPTGVELTPHLSVSKEEGKLRCRVKEFSFFAPLEFEGEVKAQFGTQSSAAELLGIAESNAKGATLFDIGAADGLISALFCSLDPGNRVFSFEPSPNSRRRLESIREINGITDRMSIEPIAIGEANSEVDMLFDSAGGYVQISQYRGTLGTHPEKIRVPVQGIADASERLQVIPEFIKLDVEGYEFEAVKGAERFLTQHKPTLFFEMHLDYLDQRNRSPKELTDMLARCGYRFESYSNRELSSRDIYDSFLPRVLFVARKKVALRSDHSSVR